MSTSEKSSEPNSESESRLERLRVAANIQAGICDANGSPTYAAIIRELLSKLEETHPALRLLHEDPKDPHGSAIYLRLLGAAHRVALATPACVLRSWFPTTGGEIRPERAVPAFFETVERYLPLISEGMRASVQTNEVGRAAPLSAALHELGRPAGGNVRLLELGSSAGLNLWLDRYHISAGGSSWGPRDSPVQLHGHFSAGAPHSFGFQVTERRGCDLNPLDATKEHTRHLLQSFVWPEHLERFNRLNAAFRAASALQIDLSDAVVWLRDQLLARSRGSVTVVFHSVVLPYFAPEAQSELIDVIRTAGAEADADRPFAWLSLEPFGDMKRLELVSEEWPLGRRQRLAETTPHGTDVVWNPQPA